MTWTAEGGKSTSENLAEIFRLVSPDSSKKDAGSDPDLLSRSARLMSLVYGIASGSGDVRPLSKPELQTYPYCEIAAVATVVAAAAAVQDPPLRSQCLTILELIKEIWADLPPLTYQPLFLLEDDEFLSARERGQCESLLDRAPLPA